MKKREFRKLLSRHLNWAEVEVVLTAWRAEERGQKFSAGRLGLAESLARRGWLRRDGDSLRLGQTTRDLLTEGENHQTRSA